MFRVKKSLDPTLVGSYAKQLQTNLHQKIVGQDEAIEQIVNIYQCHLAGMVGPGRPIGNFLFLGPTGTGKTRLVEATCESLIGDARAVIKIDCAEFQHSHEIAKLIGSPPGYLGHRETHPMLSQEVLNQYHTDNVKISFVLFDEIEKASDALWNLMLGILDKATLTLGTNQRVDFSRAMIFMTSNLGTSEMSAILRPNLGFASAETERRHQAGKVDEKLVDKICLAGTQAARRKFTPEFMNRIDKTVVFRPLGESELRKILTLELDILQQRVFNSSQNHFIFSVTDAAKNYLLREGTDLKYGARHLKRTIEQYVTQPLSNLIATKQVREGYHIEIGFSKGRIKFTKKTENMPPYAMVSLLDKSLAASFAAADHRRSLGSPHTLNARSSRMS